MKTAIKMVNAELTANLQAYVDRKLQSLERFVHGDGALCEVELRKESGVGQSGDIYYAEANLTIDGTLYRGTSHQGSFQAALDTVKDELLSELRKRKQKRMTFMREGGARVKHWIREFSN